MGVEIELLEPAEAQRLEELETIISRDIKGFLRVGMALKEIKEKQLYRGKYATWKQYLREEWDISKSYGHRYIEAYNVVENLKLNFNERLPMGNLLENDKLNPNKRLPIGNLLENDKLDLNKSAPMGALLEEESGPEGSSSVFDPVDSVDLILPRNERQARPLTLLPPEQQATAWQQVVKKTDGKVTALAVAKVVQDILDAKREKERQEVQKKIAKEVTVPDDFSEQFNRLIGILALYRKARWNGFNRKRALEYLHAIEDYLNAS